MYVSSYIFSSDEDEDKYGVHDHHEDDAVDEDDVHANVDDDTDHDADDDGRHVRDDDEDDAQHLLNGVSDEQICPSP